MESQSTALPLSYGHTQAHAKLVSVAGFEPATPCSQSKCASSCATPRRGTGNLIAVVLQRECGCPPSALAARCRHSRQRTSRPPLADGGIARPWCSNTPAMRCFKERLKTKGPDSFAGIRASKGSSVKGVRLRAALARVQPVFMAQRATWTLAPGRVLIHDRATGPMNRTAEHRRRQRPAPAGQRALRDEA